MNPDVIRPEWLPDTICTDGAWDAVVTKLYQIFETDIKYSNLKFNTLPVWHDRRIVEKYEEGFWHLISRNAYNSDHRIFDPRRSERLPWFKPIIVNFLDKNILFWENLDSKRKINIYLWFVSGDYVIILQKKSLKIGDVAFIKTAYYIDGDSTRRNLRRKFDKRII